MVATVHDGAGQGGHQVGRQRGDQGATPAARPPSIHDEDAHGPLQADRTAAGQLASVADLVHYVWQRDALPLGEAAALVLAELVGAGPGLELFETQAGRFARRVDDAWQCEPPNAEPRSFWELNALPEPATLRGLAGALQAVRLAWVHVPATRAALAQLPCARLAVRLSWATECFAYGRPAEPAPVLPATLPPHDDSRWGIARTAAARPVDLVRVADVVRAAMQPGGAHAKGLPLHRAVAWVLAGLTDLPAHAWHRLKPAADPQRISDADEWRPAYPAGSHYRAEPAADAYAVLASLSVFAQLDPMEAAARGLQGEPSTWPNHYAPEAASWPALPALRGRAGVLQWLRECWAVSAASVHDLDAGSAAWLAVPARDVAGLAWLVLDARAELGAADVARAKPEPAAAAWRVEPAGGRWPHVAGEWTDAEREAAFLMRHKHKRSDSDLVKVIGVTRQAINEQIGDSHRTVARAKVPSWPDKWQPSADLLRECGLALQPLQALQAAATGTR